VTLWQSGALVWPEATGVQTGANVLENIPTGLAGAIDGSQCRCASLHRAGTQILDIGIEFTRAAEGTV
jgi:hypothetical protein